jgi:hypothetical protein
LKKGMLMFHWRWHHQLWWTACVATPLWAKCEDETHTPKSGNLESSGTPKNSKLDCRGQNTSHWGFLYINGKVLKCRCPKWPCMSIWTFATQVMGKRRAGSQTGNLTPDH